MLRGEVWRYQVGGKGERVVVLISTQAVLDHDAYRVLYGVQVSDTDPRHVLAVSIVLGGAPFWLDAAAGFVADLHGQDVTEPAVEVEHVAGHHQHQIVVVADLAPAFPHAHPRGEPERGKTWGEVGPCLATGYTPDDTAGHVDTHLHRLQGCTGCG
ncbi:MAG: hypothetical protein ACRDSE_08200 [Pseudonocardiaceae bacterium]